MRSRRMLAGVLAAAALALSGCGGAVGAAGEGQQLEQGQKVVNNVQQQLDDMPSQPTSVDGQG